MRTKAGKAFFTAEAQRIATGREEDSFVVLIFLSYLYLLDHQHRDIFKDHRQAPILGDLHGRFGFLGTGFEN